MRLLVVEDDAYIGDGIVQSLELEDYAVDWVKDLASAKLALKGAPYEMMILDIGLPDGSGIDFLCGIRAQNNNIPVLILTAYDDTAFKVKGLDSGADDYLVKPFKVDELMSRLRALRRRSFNTHNPVLQAGPITLDPTQQKVTFKGEGVELSPKEFTILHALMEKPGRVLSRNQLAESLYNWQSEVDSNTVEVHIHGIRKKLAKDAVETLRHVGYRIGYLKTAEA